MKKARKKRSKQIVVTETEPETAITAFAQDITEPETAVTAFAQDITEPETVAEIAAAELPDAPVPGAHELTETATAAEMIDAPVPGANELTESVLDDLVQSEPVLDALLLTEGEEEKTSAPVVVKPALGRAVGKPSGFGKKTRSINELCVVECDKEKKTRGKMKKTSGKKRQKI